MTKRFLDISVRRLASLMCAAVLLASVVFSPTHAMGQQYGPYHQPLSQHSPPGQTAAWMNAIRNYDPTWLQPLLVEAPGGGQVEVFSGSPRSAGNGASPLLIAVNAGHVYRLRVSGMPQYPGLEIYPSIELIDHLHPPAGREDEFPIPIVLTHRDIRSAESGQLVTRVIYLEQPQIAQQLDPLRREIPQSVEPKDNALWEADRLGRPMAIIRVGGRRPSVNSPMSFFGSGGTAQVRQPDLPEPSGGGVVRMNSPFINQRVSHQFRR